MTPEVRFARPEDYRHAPDASSEPDSGSLVLTERLQRNDERSARLDPHFRRVVATTSAKVVGVCATFGTWIDEIQPGRVWVNVSVVPAWRGRGLDARMIRHALADLEGEVTELATCVREDHLPHLGFLEELQFEEVFRSWGAHLDLREFDPSHFDPLIRRLEREGFSFPALADIETEENVTKLRDLKRDIDRDVLSFDPIVPSGRGEFLGPDVIREGLIVAVNQGGDIVGMATLRRDSPGGAIESGLTGVRREYRGRGIATAVKVRSLAVAKELGATEIVTGGGGTNAPMKLLNRKLGFEVGPEWVTLISKRS